MCMYIYLLIIDGVQNSSTFFFFFVRPLSFNRNRKPIAFFQAGVKHQGTA